jgi:predicted nucleotidyltransferase
MPTTGPGQSSLLLLDVIDVLNKERILYVIVGAFAVSFYGVVRASLDADAVISMKDNDLALGKLMNQLKAKGITAKLSRGDVEDPIRAVLNIEDSHHNRVDLLLGIKGLQESVFQRAVGSQFMGINIDIIGVEDLIALKMFAAGPKDIQDVIGILQISAKIINLPLLTKITSHYGKKELKQLQTLLKKYNL